MANIVILVHETARTGAPILLLNYLKGMDHLQKHTISFIVRCKGDLQNDFAAIGKVYDWDQICRKYDHLRKFSSRRIFYSLGHRGNAFYIQSFLNKKFKKGEKNILICNSIATAGWIYQLQVSRWDLRTIVHESAFTIQKNNQQGEVDWLVRNSKKLICVSKTVLKDLKSIYGEEHNYLLLKGGIHYTTLPEEKRGVAIEKTFRLLCVGYLDWNKGTDIFIQLASLIRRSGADLSLQWVGAQPESTAGLQLQHDIQRLSLTDRVKLLPATGNMAEHYGQADLVLILSRNESLSLTALECSALKIPFLCFEGSGGPNEIIDSDSRFMVPYLDVNALFERILQLQNNPGEREEMGRFAHSLVQREYNMAETSNFINQALFA